jgi:hypothetical protein
MLTGANGCYDESIDAIVEQKRVEDAWPAAWAAAAGLVTSFLRARPALRLAMPRDGDPQQSRGWPSPRTWEYATRALTSAATQGLSAASTDELFAAFVGPGAALEFVAWKAQLDLPDPAEVLDGKVKWSPDPRRLDVTHAVLGACVALVQSPDAPKRKERARVLWGLLGQLCVPTSKQVATGAPALAKDVAVPSVRTLCSKHVNLQVLEESKPVRLALRDVLVAAGVVAKS